MRVLMGHPSEQTLVQATGCAGLQGLRAEDGRVGLGLLRKWGGTSWSRGCEDGSRLGVAARGDLSSFVHSSLTADRHMSTEGCDIYATPPHQISAQSDCLTHDALLTGLHSLCRLHIFLEQGEKEWERIMLLRLR